jgi:hypothetical protein
MKQTLLFSFSSFALIVFLTGCTSQMAAPGLSTEDKEEECISLDRKLIKVDEFLETVNRSSAFHLQEEDLAMEAPGITESNNKKRMLKDGNTRRAELEAERQKMGCEPLD